MQIDIFQSPADFLSLESKQAINVVMVYEDYAGGLRAKRLYDNLCRQLKPECEVNQSMWKFEVLASPRLSEMAAEEAAEADLVILSLRGDVGLPGKVKDWIETWVGEKGSQGSALVVLFDDVEEDRNEIASIQACLRQLARRGEMSFFADPAGSSEWDTEPVPERMGVRVEPAAAASASINNSNPPSRHWGINE
jgi:hypothetical protein